MVNTRPYGYFSPTAAQLMAARAGLKLSVEGLAAAAGLGVNTVRRAETGGAGVLTPANGQRLVMTLEGLGITFLEANEAGPGVRFAQGPSAT